MRIAASHVGAPGSEETPGSPSAPLKISTERLLAAADAYRRACASA